jgi:carboxylesterase
MSYSAGSFVLPGNRVGFLLLHGLGGSPVELKFLASGLARAGHTVVCPLLAGHGATTAEFDQSRWTEWYLSAEGALREMRHDCDIIIVGGISAGAVIALRLAAEHPDVVTAGALYAPTFWPNGWAIPKAFHLFKLVTQKWCANLISLSEVAPYGIKDERIRKMVLDSLTAGGKTNDEIFGRKGGTLLEFKWLAKDTKTRLGKIRQPVLIFHPRFDDQSDLSNSIMLQRQLAGRVETMVLEDSYHMVTLDRQRQLVVDRSIQFAATLTADVAADAERQRLRASVRASVGANPQRLTDQALKRG